MSNVGSYINDMKRNVGNYKKNWIALLPLWMQPKRKRKSPKFDGLIDLKGLEGLPAEHAKGLINDAILRNLKHLTETEVYIKIVYLMVDCKKSKTDLANELYNHFDQITNNWDNGRVK